MKILVIANQKGGVGKTTFAAHLAVEAGRQSDGPVALIDTDPQASLDDWWSARPVGTPALVRSDVDKLGWTLDKLRVSGFKLVIIDTPPQVSEAIRLVIAHADLVLIPTRPSPLDLRAVGATIALVELEKKRMVFALNGAANRAKITGEAAIALSQHGTVAPVALFNRTVFASAMADGRTAIDLDADSDASQEVQRLWTYVRGQLSK